MPISPTFIVLTMLSLGVAVACADEPAADSSGDVTSAVTEPAKVVALEQLALRISPEDGAAVVTMVSAGTPLARLADSLPPAPGSSRWLRVATWDERSGWVPADRTIDAGRWAGYATALGGAPIALRAAYPIDGEWAVEAPPYSSGITPISTVWVLGDSAWSARIAAIDTVAGCRGATHRIAWLDAVPAGGAAPDLTRAGLALPASHRPAATRLAVAPLATPEARLKAAALDEAGRRFAPPEVPRVWFYRVGQADRWVTLRWAGPAGVVDTAAALLLQPDGAGWRAATVVAPSGTRAAADRSPLVPTAAYETVVGQATLFLVNVVDSIGARVDIHLAGVGGYQRLRVGYNWGC